MMNYKNKHIKNDEINFLELIKKIWFSKKTIIKVTFVFFIISLIIAFLSTPKFTAYSTFIPQSSESKRDGNLTGLASLAGISLDDYSIGGEISPSLYPQILNSVPVLRSILKIEVPLNDSLINYKDYLDNRPISIISIFKKYTIELPYTLLNVLIKNNNTQKNNFDQYKSLVEIKNEKNLFDKFINQVSLNVNEKDGYINLSVTSDNPIVSALLTKEIKEILQNKIIEFKIQHATEYLNFTEKQFLEKQKEYYSLQDEVGIIKDKNRSISSERYQNQLKQKEGELLIVQTVYQELARNLEQAKLKVAKDTPIFSTITPANIPTEKSAPKRTLIILLYSLFGFILSIIIVIAKKPFNEILDQIKNN